MARRQQVENQLGAAPPVAPVAGPTGSRGLATGQIRGRDVGLESLARFSAELRKTAGRIEEDRREGFRAAAQAKVAQNQQLVDMLVEGSIKGSAGERETAEQARARLKSVMRQAYQAGLIEKVDDPYFQVELTVAAGQDLAANVRRRAEARYAAGEHLRKDGENGDVKPGAPIEDIWNEELERTSGAFVLESPLASRAYAQELERSQAALFDAAHRSFSQDEVRRATETKTRQITEAILATGGATPEESDALLGPTDDPNAATATTRIQELFDSNVENARDLALRAVLDAAEFAAIHDPERARTMLRRVQDSVMVNGRPMGEDPVLAVQLDAALDELEDREIDDIRTKDERRQAEIRETATVLQEDAARLFQEKLDEGLSPRAARDVVNRELRIKLEESPHRGVVGTELREYVDALAADRSSDPLLRDEILASIGDSDTEQDLAAVEAQISFHTGHDLFGADLQAIREELKDRRDLLTGGGLGNDGIYRAYMSSLVQAAAPDTMPDAERNEVDEELSTLRRRFIAEAVAMAKANGGKAPAVAMEEAGLKYRQEAKRLVETAEATMRERMAEARKDAETGMRPRDLEAKWGAQLGPRAMTELRTTAADINVAKQRLRRDRDVLAVRTEVVTQAAVSLATRGIDPQSPEFDAAIQETQAGFDRVVEEALEGMGAEVDYAGRLEGVTRAVREYSQELRTKNRSEVEAALAAAGEGAEAQAEAIKRTQANITDLANAHQITAPTAGVYTLAQNPRLSALVPDQELAQRLVKAQRMYTGGHGTPGAGGHLKRPMERPIQRAGWELTRRWEDLEPGQRPGAVVAALAPLGALTPANVLGDEPVQLEIPPALDRPGLLDAIRIDGPPPPVKIQAKDVPPFSTPLFQSLKDLEKFGESPDFKRLMKKYQILTDTEEDQWVDAQSRLIRQLGATQ